KGSRKEYFFNTYYHSLSLSDHVIIQAERGEDIGLLSKKIEIEMNFEETAKPRSILRPASDDDMARLRELRRKEIQHETEVIEMIGKHGLDMKVVDVEWQFDGNKMTVFFTADHRVDFRELVKDLAARYKTRIELRQIGVRDEARRLGGVGICGLEQCCNAFITEFTPISTQQAREQDLPLNPSKISGNCGRLLCCLRYEAETYETCKRMFPHAGCKVRARMGEGIIEKIDVFNEEAMIRVGEGVIVRAKADDILEIEAERAAEVHPPAAAVGEEIEDAETQEELKKLDDSEKQN
ncbi:MAG: stage 0 sporulation protein, partial [Candidatus Zixiibacteriota bacterium]